jgi:hypothetical protein
MVRALLAVVLVTALYGCGSTVKSVERHDVPSEELKRWTNDDVHKKQKQSPFLKAHMRNGDLFVLDDWHVNDDRSVVTGGGTHYDAWRNVIAFSGTQFVPVDSVVLFETNQLGMAGSGAALTVVSGVTVAVALICITNPKSCFGSCPTFYLDGSDRPFAEGFSASISPSLEATDVDALPAGAYGRGRFTVTMKNEALETHVVRHVDVLAVPHRRNAQTFHTDDGRFCAVSALAAPASAIGAEGDCLAAIRAADGVERFVRADSTDLSQTEVLDLAFDHPAAGRRALVVGCRQTLLSTYVLYQAFAYMGSETGYWLSRFERGEIGNVGATLTELFASITVRIEAAPGRWTEVGRIAEFGPIAVDHHVILFDAPHGWTGGVRLEMTRGGWRIDEVALGAAAEMVEPVRLHPAAVYRDGEDDAAARAQLLDPAHALTTLPGDTYQLVYHLPRRASSYDLFLESRGYYLEWIRNEWIAEENGALLTELFLNPRAGLQRMAPGFKKAEPDMERIFWNSRYAKP